MLKRIVEKEVGGSFVRCEFQDLKEGDRFRLFEPQDDNAEPVGGGVWTATSDAFASDNGHWTISCERTFTSQGAEE